METNFFKKDPLPAEKIIDKNGRPTEITDLQKALEQAEYFKDAHHVPPAVSDKERQLYWRDMYEKLLELKTQLDKS